MSFPHARHWSQPLMGGRGRARATTTSYGLQLQILGPVIIWEGAVRKLVLSSVSQLAKSPPQKIPGVAFSSRTPPPCSHPAGGLAESSTDESGLSHLTPPPLHPSGVCPAPRDPSFLYTVPEKASGDGKLEGWFLVGAVFKNE